MAKRSKRSTERSVFVPDEPNWGPLEQAVMRRFAGPFMFMYGVELKNGARAYCYKHSTTRRSLHITEDLEAYLYSYDPRGRSRDAVYERVAIGHSLGEVVLLPEFENGWFAHRQFARPERCDENGEVIEEEDGEDAGFYTRYEQLKAHDAWRASHFWDEPDQP